MSKISELKALENQHEATQQRISQLRKELEGVGKIADRVRQEAEKAGLDLREICYALVPALEIKAKKSAGAGDEAPKQQRVRRTKRYTNPENGEVIETKGGNHKGLAEWKKKHGADKVESWGKYVD